MLGYMMGLDQMPGVLTICGTLFAIGGIFYIDKGFRERTAKQATIRDEESCYEESMDDIHNLSVQYGSYQQALKDQL